MIQQGTDEDCNTPIAECDTPLLTESMSLIDSNDSKRTLLDPDSTIAIEVDIAMDQSWASLHLVLKCLSFFKFWDDVSWTSGISDFLTLFKVILLIYNTF